MSFRSNGRNLSFEILSDYIPSSGEPPPGEVTPRRKRKRKPRKKKHNTDSNITLETIPNSDDESLLLHAQDIGFKVLESSRSVCGGSTTVVNQVDDSPSVSCVRFELRQRNVNGGLGDADVSDELGNNKDVQDVNAGFKREGHDVDVRFKGLEKEKSLDWNQVMKDNTGFPHDSSFLEKSPLKYFLGEVYSGNSLRSTISVGNDKKRQRVYNSMFHVPWRCERLLRPNAAELADYGCFIVLGLGVASLQMIDISLIYHVIRGQGTIKLYVVYNVLEIFDKLCQSFGEDVLQVLFNSAEGLSSCSKDNLTSELMQFVLDEAIAVIAFVVHSFVLLAQAITLSTCIIAHNNALLALLVSNNFAEIKSNVFKRVSKENLHNLVYYDIIERFHIMAFLLFVLAQNLLEAEGPWFSTFVWNALEVYVCEIFIDAVKHSFLAKFNEIKPVAYSDFLEDLCRQILNDKPDERQKDLTFIPLAPACVVIRVLTPVYATFLPSGPFHWRVFWIIVWSSLTYITLAVFKTLVILLLRFLATWYVNLRLKTKQHVD
ncbi:protein POLLEN DEFECTIVE IN GUIDANCE 1-like isoform X2 [Carex rostrata]